MSPVSVFLREEVCAVSDHLASVSLFGSEEWMTCLHNFNGWVDSGEEAEELIRSLVSKLKLRPLSEPGDVDSPLLRSQIDKHYLHAMASARAQMAGNGSQEDRRTPRGPPTTRKEKTQTNSKKSNTGNPNHGEGHPPVYPRQTAAYSPHIHGATPGGAHPGSLRRPRLGYPPQHGGQWWGNNWNPHGPFPFGDDASVHSSLSVDSYAQQYDMNGYPLNHHPYYHPMMYPQHQLLSGQPQVAFDPSMADPSLYPLMDGFNPQMSHIPLQTGVPPGFPPGSPGGPVPTQDAHSYSQTAPIMAAPEQVGGDHTPHKYNPNQVPMSPYWGHLDHATLAMMGIATPQGPAPPQTPARGGNPSIAEDGDLKQVHHAAAVNAQPLLLRQQYYGYGVSQ